MIKTTLIKFSFIIILLSSLSADSLSLIAVGDIMMGFTYPENNLPPNRRKDLFTNAAQIIREADLSKLNIESTLLTGGRCVKK